MSRVRWQLWASVAALVLAVVGGVRCAAQESRDSAGFYVLALSWAPNYCNDPGKPHSASECGGHLGFVVHGIWPQDAQGNPLPECEGGRPLSRATVDRMMQFIPDRGLIAHEWRVHLSCHFRPDEIVRALEQATAAVKIPERYRETRQEISVAPQAIEGEFAGTNQTRAEDYRVSCHAGKLVNFEACLTPDFKARSCAAMRECNARSVSLDPTS